MTIKAQTGPGAEQTVPEQSDTVELADLTAMTLQRIRGQQDVADARDLDLDLVRCNVLLRKGLVENVGLGKWRATDRGRRVAIRMKGSRS